MSEEYVWYAVYGSNLKRERFKVYIPNHKILGEKPIIIPHSLRSSLGDYK